ncbi:hypothetical protein EW146_g6826 [Bondarzewia mesenterica]|uniref:Alpha/beta hydrolase fold-3 domain-containing protein n=1 Tax=Bondarzewia mesenterica TaxID=1095465 RepID=A0A4S4LMF6_9AGAM|nr:hypothetical protein EW146_g6826 [Bondarzewia mesenterica]
MERRHHSSVEPVGHYSCLILLCVQVYLPNPIELFRASLYNITSRIKYKETHFLTIAHQPSSFELQASGPSFHLIMSQYSHLSTPDPEFTAFMKKMGPAPPLQTDIHVSRALLENTMRGRPVLSLPSASVDQCSIEYEYLVKQYEVPVDGGDIAVRCFVPTSKDVADDGKRYPLLVWYHGGALAFIVGWSRGSLDMDDTNLRQVCVEKQISVVNVAYRLAPEHPFPIGVNDCYAALKWAAEHTRQLSADLSRGFLVGGTSAGGNLSAVMALRARDDPFFSGRPLTGQLLGYPAVCDLNAYPKKYTALRFVPGSTHMPFRCKIPIRYTDDLLSLEQNKDAPVLSKAGMIWTTSLLKATPTDPDFSPLLAKSHAGLPPTFIQVCGMDPLRDEAILYEKILREQRVKSRLCIYPGVPHAFNLLFPTLSASQQYEKDFREAIGWMLEINQVENVQRP